MSAADVDERERQQDEADRLRHELEESVWAVLNLAEAHRAPHVVAYALAAVLLRVLTVSADTKPEDIEFGLRLLAELEKAFTLRTTPDRTSTTH